ncbi:hypothetical protein FF36_05163 [Frankia torreyi]|uniref:Uncharacterized protein n=1 Tax=Frankia torreyi TaxID=1856 RepID=A0A0D8B8P2_9ACTN|nr:MULTISPECIES: hypothetical protein [Frankia]KJE20571.1 hypothetical protein FF36_05163 [Frankia torreyi]KQM02864.1 hypothetical protein FF86_10534 [Frankia sp. CpI1-P]
MHPAPAPTAPKKPAAKADAVDPARRQRIAAQVCQDYQADRLQPHEVIVKANGEIWIDRCGTYPDAVPFQVGRWS